MPERSKKLHDLSREVRLSADNADERAKFHETLEALARKELARCGQKSIRERLPQVFDLELARKFFSALAGQAGSDVRTVNFLGPERITGPQKHGSYQCVYRTDYNIIHLNQRIFDPIAEGRTLTDPEQCELIASLGHEEVHAVSKNVCVLYRPTGKSRKIATLINRAGVHTESIVSDQFRELNEGFALLTEIEFLAVYARIKKYPPKEEVRKFIDGELSYPDFRRQTALAWYLKHVLARKSGASLHSTWKELRSMSLRGDNPYQHELLARTFGPFLKLIASPDSPELPPLAEGIDEEINRFRYEVQSYINGKRDKFPEL